MEKAVATLVQAGELPAEATAIEPQVEPPRQAAHGDFSTNAAMLLAKPCRRRPLAVAEALACRIRAQGVPWLTAVEVAAPGFVNFRLAPTAVFSAIEAILARGADYGRSTLGAGRRVQLEFVSANPTGPLHVGHGRGAAYGAALAALLRTVGFDVFTEYYVNDAGRQMDILALSVWLRYLQQRGLPMDFPANAYRGEYVVDIAHDLAASHGGAFAPAAGFRLPAADADADADKALDAAIAACRQALGEDRYRTLHARGCTAILAGIRADLERFGVVYDGWYSERGLLETGAIATVLSELRTRGHVYERHGAEWFHTTAYGDEKDRVVIRENGAATYFASDIAYHADKFARGFDTVINVWGADHHGYIPRVRAALAALGIDPQRLEVLLVQFATLYRGGERVQMSTRSGEFVTLAELIDEVGADAARFFYITRRADQHLDFDLDLAKAQSQDNPVYYLQYAHARICSIFAQLVAQGRAYDRGAGGAALGLLVEVKERALAALLGRYPDIVQAAALGREPHLIANYLREIATEFHAFYNSHKVIVEDPALCNARLALLEAVRIVLAAGLALLGVSAPTQM